jgi:hypothetical protein
VAGKNEDNFPQPAEVAQTTIELHCRSYLALPSANQLS